ncbi:hypothetical protein HHL22_07960 [Hymenobacter sp. RP-2-7]|uniref:Uncharacterized protein n=1 Tax=Hymenobacter polaris TaxID=2682546 RepID=A0A7Y0AD53_9BACT|nr:hypothetical protein [Hymenobacter polaris]NML65139.1 hypothetical protein [Hymenobacter polaris]
MLATFAHGAGHVPKVISSILVGESGEQLSAKGICRTAACRPGTRAAGIAGKLLFFHYPAQQYAKAKSLMLPSPLANAYLHVTLAILVPTRSIPISKQLLSN